MNEYKTLSEHFDKMAEALYKDIENYFEYSDEEDNYYRLRTLFTSLSIKNKDKFYRTFFKEVVDVLAVDGEVIHYLTVRFIYRMIQIIDAKIKEILTILESKKEPEDFSILIYKRDILYPDEWDIKQLKFLTKIIPNSELKHVQTKKQNKIFLDVKFPNKFIVSISEFLGKMKKKGERKKKLKSFEKVLEKTVALKRIQKFASRIGEGIIAKRPFDSLVFY
jgi:hypothetical protein